jgi:hypothetical protein
VIGPVGKPISDGFRTLCHERAKMGAGKVELLTGIARAPAAGLSDGSCCERTDNTPRGFGKKAGRR